MLHLTAAQTLLLMLALFQIKHFLADYPLQTAWMLRKTERYGWALPLICHSLVHALLTLYVVLPFVGLDGLGVALLCCYFDWMAHFCIDYWKAQLTHYKVNQKAFWVSLGADQMFHHLTYLLLTGVALDAIH